MSTIVPYTGLVIPFSFSRGQIVQNENSEQLANVSTRCLAIYRDATERPATETYEKLTQQFEDITYFPEEKMDPLFQLVYLTTLTRESVKSPYSRETTLQLQKTYDAIRSAKSWLRAAFITAFIFPLAIYGLSNVKNATNAQWFVIVSLLINVMGAMIGVVGTGSNPDYKSDMLNRRQDLLNNILPLISLEMCVALLEVKKLHPALAELIAQKLDLDLLEELMLKRDPSSDKAVEIGSARDAVIKRLFVAKAHVLNQQLPRPSPYTSDLLHILHLDERQQSHVIIPMDGDIMF